MNFSSLEGFAFDAALVVNMYHIKANIDIIGRGQP
jgi:hypothetical protein